MDPDFHHKALPPLPLPQRQAGGPSYAPNRPIKPPVGRRNREVSECSELKRHNATLAQSLRESEEANAELRRKLAAYEQYIQDQDRGLAEVIKIICAAFQGYRDSVVQTTRRAATNVNSVDSSGGDAT